MAAHRFRRLVGAPMADPIVEYLEAHLPEYLADLETLVNQDSGSYDKVGIDHVNDWLDDRLVAAGFDIDRRPQVAFGDDLVARLRGSGGGRIMVLGHSDTVFPPGTAAERPLTISGNQIKGPGVCDMKAGLLSGIYAVEALSETGWAQFGELTFIVVSDEEIGERHSIEMLKYEGPKHDAILTLEAARENGDIVTARKAVAWFTVDATGHAAHAGVEPEKGSSAILAISRLVTEAARLNDLREGITVNPGVLAGGVTPNVVADRASVRFDLRAWTNEGIYELEKALRELAEREWVPGVRLEMWLEPGSDCPAMERTDGVIALERKAIEIARELGFPLRGAATGGGSDISFASHRGTPGLDGLGPVGGLDHGPDEYILQDSIVPRTALLAKLVQAIGGRQVGRE